MKSISKVVHEQKGLFGSCDVPSQCRQNEDVCSHSEFH